MCDLLVDARHYRVNLFQPSVTFHVDTSHLIRNENQMTGSYMEYNTGLKWVKLLCFEIRKPTNMFY